MSPETITRWAEHAAAGTGGQDPAPFALALFAALAGGIVSFLSPCVLPLVPPYLGYMAGASVSEMAANPEGERAARWRVVCHAAAFVAGLGAIFILLLGFGASLMGALTLRYRAEFAIGAGAIVALFGLHFLGVLRIGFLQREARVASTAKPVSHMGSFLLGAAFAFGWTPCIGPILASILALAANQEGSSRAILLLGVYTLGLGMPFILAAMFFGRFTRLLHRLRPWMGAVKKAMGVLLLLVGLLLVTDQFTLIAIWMLDTMPWLARIG